MLLLLLVFIPVVVVLSMAAGALTVGLSAAMFLDLPFQHGWSSAWGHKGYLALFSLVVVPFLFRERSDRS